VIKKILLVCFGLEHIRGMDKLTFYDDERGYTNIVAFMRMDRPDSIETLRDHLL